MLDPGEAARGLAEALRAFAEATGQPSEPRAVRVSVGPVDGQPIYLDVTAATAMWLDDAIRTEAAAARGDGTAPGEPW